MITDPSAELISVRVDRLDLDDLHALAVRFDRAADDVRFGTAPRRFFGDLSDRLTDVGAVRPSPSPGPRPGEHRGRRT